MNTVIYSKIKVPNIGKMRKNNGKKNKIPTWKIKQWKN